MKWMNTANKDHYQRLTNEKRREKNSNGLPFLFRLLFPDSSAGVKEAMVPRHPPIKNAFAAMLTTMKGTSGTYPLSTDRIARPTGMAAIQHLAAEPSAAPTSPPRASFPYPPKNGAVRNQPKRNGKAVSDTPPRLSPSPWFSRPIVANNMIAAVSPAHRIAVFNGGGIESPSPRSIAATPAHDSSPNLSTRSNFIPFGTGGPFGNERPGGVVEITRPPGPCSPWPDVEGAGDDPFDGKAESLPCSSPVAPFGEDDAKPIHEFCVCDVFLYAIPRNG